MNKSNNKADFLPFSAHAMSNIYTNVKSYPASKNGNSICVQDGNIPLPHSGNANLFLNDGSRQHLHNSNESSDFIEIHTQQDIPIITNPDDFIMSSQGAASKLQIPWARLITKGSNVITYELHDIPPDSEGRYNLCYIGRSSQCSIRFETSPRISNKHCIIYCKLNKARDQPFLEAWIEDLSANGTYINKTTRLKKNIPRLLRTGDEISLVNPDLVKVVGANVSIHDVSQSSFLSMIDLPNPYGSETRILRSQTIAKALEESSIHRSSTVVRLLNQQRNIYDYYEFRECLGTGATGQVFLGIKKDTGENWAIKVIDTRKLDLKSDSSVTKEAEMLRSIRHPNIIHLEDIFSENHLLYLVMELSTGGDLFDRITKKSRYSESEARTVMIQLLEAIEYLHMRKVAHRDLKPENILLTNPNDDTNIKITDFGLAKVVDEKEGFKSFCGTPQYFAPEVLQRKNTVNGLGRYFLEADMWSVGVIMYVLLAGAFPFHGSDSVMAQQMLKGIYNMSSGVWSNISTSAKQLISQMLAVNPSKRLTATQALNHPWIQMGFVTAPGTLESNPNPNPNPNPAPSSSSAQLNTVTRGKASLLDLSLDRGFAPVLSQDDILMPPPAPVINLSGESLVTPAKRKQVSVVTSSSGSTDRNKKKKLEVPKNSAQKAIDQFFTKA